MRRNLTQLLVAFRIKVKVIESPSSCTATLLRERHYTIAILVLFILNNFQGLPAFELDMMRNGPSSGLGLSSAFVSVEEWTQNR